MFDFLPMRATLEANDGGAKMPGKHCGGDVTLYIPYFNSQDMIGECLAGILRQTVRPARLIIFDDASNPPASSVEAVRLSGAEVIRLETNIGLGASRNMVLEHCKTPLLASLDSDVVAEPTWLERLLATLNANPGAAGVAGRLDELRQDTLGDRWRAVHMKQHWGDQPLVNPRFLYGANNLFVASALRDAGGYISSLKTNYEDMSLSERLLEKGATLLYEPAARCGHLRRDTDSSILRGYWKWFHAKGLLQGDFDSPEGVLRRIDAVNFGIFRYRFALDVKEGRPELLKLDVLIPWLFCALDLEMARRHAGIDVPEFPGELISAVPSGPLTILNAALPKTFSPGSRLQAWHAGYIAKFLDCLESFNWKDSCARAWGK